MKALMLAGSLYYLYFPMAQKPHIIISLHCLIIIAFEVIHVGIWIEKAYQLQDPQVTLCMDIELV